MDDFKRVTEVTYLGVVHGTKVALNHMIPKNRGKIIQIGSVLAYRGIPLQSAYCGSKHAIQGFNESIRSELMHDNIDIQLSMVQLPAVNTPQFEWTKSYLKYMYKPSPPIFQPEVIARAVAYSAKKSPRELDVTFNAARIIFLNKLFPGLGDIYLSKVGYKSIIKNKLEDVNKLNNLWESVEGDYEAHGKFDKEAKNESTYLWMIMNKGKVLLSIGIFIVLILKILGRSSNKR